MPIERVTNVYKTDHGLDEIVATNAYVHVERMDNNRIWMCVEADGRRIAAWFSAKGTIKAYVEDEGRALSPSVPHTKEQA